MKKQPQENVETGGSDGSLSARTYAFIAVGGLVFALGFTFFYVYEVPRLVANRVQAQVFYLLLLPWALACVAFLFGAMKSYARFKGKHLGSVLELGGPVVLFCLVLVGGFKLVPPSPSAVNLSVRAISTDNPMITSGEVVLDLPGLPSAKIGADGEANFKGFSSEAEKPIKVMAKVDGYTQEWLVPEVNGNILTVRLQRANPYVVQAIVLVPPPPQGKPVRIRVDSQAFDPIFDELGGTKLTIDGQPGDGHLFEVFLDKRLMLSEYHQLGTTGIKLHWNVQRGTGVR